MRIALISYEYSDAGHAGGIGTYMRNVAHMLVGRGHSVAVFTNGTGCNTNLDGVAVSEVAASRREFKDAILPLFAECHAARPFELVESAEYGADAMEISKAYPEIARVVKLHTPSYLIGEIEREYISPMRKMRYRVGSLRRGRIASLGAYDAKSDPERYHALSADEITVPSLAVLREVSKKWCLPINQVAILPNVFTPSPALLKINAHTLTNRITYLGRLEVRKGIIEFAKAIPMVLAKMPSASFRVIGAAALHPNDGQNIKNTLLSILGPAAQAVEFVDWVTYKEMPKYLSDTDICVFPSVWENFPYTCMEAMSAARAVVGSNSGGMAEIIDHNRTGFLIPAKQPKCIAAAIIELLLFPQKGIEMGLAAREHIKRSYAAEQISPLYEASYRRALVRAQVRNRGPLYWGRTHLDPAI